MCIQGSAPHYLIFIPWDHSILDLTCVWKWRILTYVCLFMHTGTQKSTKKLYLRCPPWLSLLNSIRKMQTMKKSKTMKIGKQNLVYTTDSHPISTSLEPLWKWQSLRGVKSFKFSTYGLTLQCSIWRDLVSTSWFQDEASTTHER